VGPSSRVSHEVMVFHEFTHIFEPFEQLLALDQVTKHLDFRVARVHVGLCEVTQLSPL
jgi:hypothetical protein